MNSAGDTPRPGRAWTYIRAHLDLLSLVVVGTCLAWWVSPVFWAADLLTAFLAQAGAIAAMLTVVWLIAKRWVRGVLCALALSTALLALLPGRVMAPEQPRVETDRVRILVANVLGRNMRADSLLEVIDREDPDVVVTLETGAPLVEALRDPGAAPTLPHRFIADRAGPGFMVLLSRWPQLAQRPDDPDNPALWKGGPAATTTPLGRVALIERPAGAFLVFGIHPDSPHRMSRWRDGNQHVRDLLSRRDQLLAFDADLPVLIAGDLNTTPGGARQRIFDAAGLRRAKPLTANPAGTWPDFLPMPLKIAIDDAVVDERTRVLAWRTIELEGSDHLGVVIDLEIHGRE